MKYCAVLIPKLEVSRHSSTTAWWRLFQPKYRHCVSVCLRVYLCVCVCVYVYMAWGWETANKTSIFLTDLFVLCCLTTVTRDLQTNGM